MGLSKDGTYSASDANRVYMVVEVSNGDGWVIGWKTPYGKAVREIKSYGRFGTVEEAQAALDELAVKNGWQYLVMIEDTKGKRVYDWFTARHEPVELSA